MSSLVLIRRFSDLLGCMAVALVMLVIALLSVNTPGMAVLGSALVFVVPGYALSCLLWAGDSTLGIGDRIIFSVGLSASLAVFSVLVLSLTGAGIFPLTVTLSLAYEGLVFSVAAMALRYARQLGVPRDVTESAHRARRILARDKPFWAVVAALLLGGAVLVALIVSTPPPALSTQFYLLGPDGSSASLPSTATVNTTVSLLVGAYNGAAQSVVFTVTVCLTVGNVSCAAPTGQYADWRAVLSLSASVSARLNLSVDAESRLESPLQFQVVAPGTYVLSLTLDGGGIHRAVLLPLTVTR